MKGSPAGRLLVPAVSCVLHALAFLQFALHRDLYGLPADWTRDYTLLLLVSLLLAAVIHVLPSPRVRIAVVVVRTVVFFVLGLPFGGFLDIRYMLMFSLLLDLNSCFSFPANAVLSSVVMASTTAFLLPLSAFSRVMPAPGLLDWSTFFLFGASFAGLLMLLRRTSDLLGESRTRTRFLDEAIAKLMSSSRDYLEYAARVQRESTEQERIRITLELHDVVGQAFTNIFAMMDASLKHPAGSREEAQELHAWVKEQAQKGLKETRAILYQLRSIRERELSGIQAIKNLVDTFSFSTKMQIRVEWGNLPWELGPELDQILYRVIQESLVNSFRHGNATEIQLHFWVSEEELSVDIQDNGTGPGPASSERGGGGQAGAGKGIGQESMESRVAAVGGMITFGANGRGYNVHLSFPKSLLPRKDPE
jgi:signal transduction histidine kinase